MNARILFAVLVLFGLAIVGVTGACIVAGAGSGTAACIGAGVR